jgi:hypothetical protein
LESAETAKKEAAIEKKVLIPIASYEVPHLGQVAELPDEQLDPPDHQPRRAEDDP